jgi:Tol biopolymer transport system component
LSDLTRLGAALSDRYRIERELGQGGMATVYLAEDIKHRRHVAIKVLHAELSAVLGPDRFLKEIELTANLQHPHILPLFDSGSADGLLFYVMPFVEGETLRGRLQREHQLPIADAVRIASDVADALAYAHKRGVVHRDIKPENILLHDGRPLVADFGIALAVEQAGGERMTQTGISLGTPQYMSPEQAMGDRAVDARADVYALGAVTYEMLAGEPPFTGPTAQAIVAKVMTERPRPLGEVRDTVPPAVEDAVHAALAKLPADRPADAAVFAAALRAPAEGTGPMRARRAGRHTRTRRSGLALAAGGVIIAAIAFLLGGRVLGHAAPPLEFGQTLQVTSEPGLSVQPAISPDGRSIAYAAGTSGGTRIYVRQVAGGRANPLTDDSAGSQSNPRWSPDGTHILFLQQNAAFSASAAGGRARQEIPAGHGSPVGSAAWAPDGLTIAYVVADSLFVRDPAGNARRVAHFGEPSLCTWAPSSALIACTAGNARYLTVGPQFGNLSPTRIIVCRVSDGGLEVVTDSTSINESPVWSPDGRWLYYVSNRRGRGDIYAQRITGGGSSSGAPVRLTTGLGAQSISISADGSRFAYGVYTAKANIWSLPVPSAPPVTAAAAVPVTTGTQIVENLRVSRDGKWLLYDSNRSGNADVYRVPLNGGEPERITTDPADDFAPDLSPDDQEVAFHSWRTGSRDIYVQPLDGRPLQHVTSSPAQELVPVWSPDGRTLAFAEGTDVRSIWLVHRDASGAWGPPVKRSSIGSWTDWSPDGKSLVFVTGLTGGSLMVMPADSGPARIVLDAGPSSPQPEEPFWSPNGATIYFKSHDASGNASIWSIPSSGGAPRLLVRFTDPARPSYRPQWAFGAGRFFFPVQDRQSDVWIMEVAKP